MRNSAADRTQNAARIREAMETLLSQEAASPGSLNVKALASLAGITRSALYSDHYSDLKDEFLRRATSLVGHGTQQNYGSEGQANRIRYLESKVRRQSEAAEEFQRFRTLAISRIAAQHEALLRCKQNHGDSAADQVDSPIEPPVILHPDWPTF